MKLIICHIVFVFTFLSVYGQGNSKIKKYKISTCTSITTKIENGETIEKKKIETFDAKGNTLEESEFINGALEKKETFKYNSNNDVIEEVIYNKDGSIKRKITKKYNVEGKVIEEVLYNGANKVVRKEVSKYNGFNEKLEEIIYDGSGEIDERHVYTYNNKSLKTERLTYDKKDRLIMKKVYTYTFK